MRKALSVALTTACLLGTFAITSPKIAGGVSARVAKTSCTTMGLTPASLRRNFGKVAVTAASYECGLVGATLEVTLYLYPKADRVGVLKEVHLEHPKRLGGLGVGAEVSNEGGGDYGLVLTSGTHAVYIDGRYVASQGRLINLAHIIYRALA